MCRAFERYCLLLTPHSLHAICSGPTPPAPITYRHIRACPSWLNAQFTTTLRTVGFGSVVPIICSLDGSVLPPHLAFLLVLPPLPLAITRNSCWVPVTLLQDYGRSRLHYPFVIGCWYCQPPLPSPPRPCRLPPPPRYPIGRVCYQTVAEQLLPGSAGWGIARLATTAPPPPPRHYGLRPLVTIHVLIVLVWCILLERLLYLALHCTLDCCAVITHCLVTVGIYLFPAATFVAPITDCPCHTHGTQF